MAGGGGLIEDLWYRDIHIHETPLVAQTLKKCPACLFSQFFQVCLPTEKQWKRMLNESLKELTIENLRSSSIFVPLCK